MLKTLYFFFSTIEINQWNCIQFFNLLLGIALTRMRHYKFDLFKIRELF